MLNIPDVNTSEEEIVKAEQVFWKVLTDDLINKQKTDDRASGNAVGHFMIGYIKGCMKE